MNINRIVAGFILSTLVAGGMVVAAQKKETEVERQLQAAINTEKVERNPKAAIKQYEKVAASGVRPLAAEALLHIADCYVALGDAEAQKVYQRIVDEYKDQKDAVSLARARLLALAAGPGGSFFPTDRTRI